MKRDDTAYDEDAYVMGEDNDRSDPHACEHCGATDNDRPTIFRGERWCSDRCRKALGEDLTNRR